MSFTILNDLDSNQSRPISSPGGRLSPFRGKGFRQDRPRRRSRPVSCPESPRSVVYPKARRPSVHFDKIDTDSASFDDAAAAAALEPERKERSPSRYSNRFEPPSSTRVLSLSPRKSFRRSLSSSHISNDDLPPRVPINNPRSYHKGLLSVISTTNATQPRMPQRRLSISNPNLSDVHHRHRVGGHFQVLGRSDSIASDLQSSIGSTASDYGTPRMGRMKRISRPTNLSPIVGTPDRDSCNDNSTPTADRMRSPVLKFRRRRSSDMPIGRVGSRRGSISSQSTPSPKKSAHKAAGRGAPTETAADNRIPLTTDAKATARSPAKRKPMTATADAKTKKPSPTKTKRGSTSPTKQPQANPNARLESPNKRGQESPSKATAKSTKDPTKPKQTAKLLKNQSDPSLAKLLQKKNSFKKRRTSSESDGFPAKEAAQLLASVDPKAAQPTALDIIDIGGGAGGGGTGASSKPVGTGPKDDATNGAAKDNSNGKPKSTNTENTSSNNNGNTNPIALTDMDNKNNNQEAKADATNVANKTADNNKAINTAAIAGNKLEKDNNEKPSAVESDNDASKPNGSDAKMVKKLSEKSLLGGEVLANMPTAATIKEDVGEPMADSSIGTPSDAQDLVRSLDSAGTARDTLDKADILSIPTEASVIDVSTDNQQKFPEMLLKANDDELAHKRAANHTNQGPADTDNIQSQNDHLPGNDQT